MSYRMYVKPSLRRAGYQFLGNNVCPDGLMEELIRQGCKPDEDGCFKSFKVKEVQPIIEILEKYIMNVYEWYKDENVNIFDFSDMIERIYSDKSNNLTSSISSGMDTWIMLASANFVKAIEDNLVRVYDREKNKIVYKIKEGKNVWITAY